MATPKLHVPQLHLTGFDSFPLVLPSRPKLVEGAFSKYEQYTLRDLAGLKEYAAVRPRHCRDRYSWPRRLVVRGHAGALSCSEWEVQTAVRPDSQRNV